MSGRAPREIDNKKYYDILGVSPTSNQDDVKEAFRKSVIKNYPDKDGDPEKIKELAEVYEVLSDPDKTEIYDKYGEDALKNGEDGGCPSHDQLDPFDVIDPVFGGTAFAGGADSSRTRFGEAYEYTMTVSLEDLYNGTSKNLSLSRYISCQQCKGKGTKTGWPTKCYACQGSGLKSMLALCLICEGSGDIISERDKCPSCKGSKCTEEKSQLKVNIDKGMKHGHEIVFKLQGDVVPGKISGDIKLILEQSAHPKFKREDDNLFVEQDLSLTESLCGFQFSLTHLDGRKLLIKSNPGEVIHPGGVKVIHNEGMPQHRKPFIRGNLYMQFNVQFPSSGFFSPEQCIAFKKALP